MFLTLTKSNQTIVVLSFSFMTWILDVCENFICAPRNCIKSYLNCNCKAHPIQKKIRGERKTMSDSCFSFLIVFCWSHFSFMSFSFLFLVNEESHTHTLNLIAHRMKIYLLNNWNLWKNIHFKWNCMLIITTIYT